MRDFLGGECTGKRLLLFHGDRDPCPLSFEGEDDELCLCLLSSFLPLSLLVVSDLERDRL